MNRYWQYEYFYIDNVFFDSALWQLSQFQIPIVFHQWWGEMNIFSDHWHPILMLFSLFYRIWDAQETLLILSVMIYALGAVFGYLIGRHFRLHFTINITLVISYFLYLGTQNAFIFGFHEIVFMGVFLLGIVWAFLKKMKKTYFVFLLLLLFTKETMAIYFLLMSPLLASLDKTRWRWVMIAVGITIIYYLISIKIVIPFISGGGYRYSYNDWPNDIFDWWNQLTNPSSKVQTFWISIFSWGGLSLFSIFSYPLIFGEFVMRFLGSIAGNVQDSLYYHYGFSTAPIIYLSSLVGAKNLLDFLSGKAEKSVNIQKIFDCKVYQLAISLLILVTLVLFHRNALPQRGPLELVFKRAFYQTTKDNQFLDELVSNVPNTSGSIMAMNHLTYHLTHKGKMIYLNAIDNPKRANKFINLKPSPDFIVYDLRKTQNANNFFPDDYESVVDFSHYLLNSGIYQVYWEKGEMMILKKVKEFVPRKNIIGN